MKPSSYQWLAGVIHAHPDHKVVGRIRLQKTIRLLQRLGMPSGYSFQLFYYGPYSDGILSDIQLLEQWKWVVEEGKTSRSGDPYFIMQASDKAKLSDIAKFRKHIDKMGATNPTVLELAATYDMFRDLGSNHKEALVRLRNKKGTKCDDGNQQKALTLLKELGLPVS